MVSISKTWREQGNAFLKKNVEGTAPVICRQNLEKSLQYYYKAENTAGDNMEDRCSAKKNSGIASLKLARILDPRKEKANLIDFYFKQALEKFSEAWEYGRGKSNEWLMGIQTLSLECFINMEDRMADDKVEDKVRQLESLTLLVLGKENKASAFSTITLLVFELALTNLAAKNFKVALSHLKDCYYPVSEGLRYSDSEEMKRTFELHQEDIYIQTCVAESMQALDIGDNMFQAAMTEEEVLNMDMIYDVLDWYRQAITLTRDKDVLLEAIAHCRLGKIYQKVLKLDDRARVYYAKCIELANTLIPRTIHQEEWYCLATEALSHYQQEDLRKEEEAKKGQREEILKEKKEELDELKKNFKDMGKVEFLIFIYKKYPPKNKKHVLGKVSDQPESPEIKKLYQKAVIHFHPDKVPSEDKVWKFMSEEIVKLLTSHYEYFK
ncbi:hypothetical protein LOTGIDRAFT_231852 [Lottia gigantea]|uniref:J domain-containing protein n=1 Tax=Lottia gigantea TaxID=225164 RepID=V4AGW1_LOTGI|nr:hypothetical protein LOTGIDRAFT_231852 [Lottia gigantea]ESO96147.1 hypothetical protein LOTGIDRAFT_231852 [Lottia gigantea]